MTTAKAARQAGWRGLAAWLTGPSLLRRLLVAQGLLLALLWWLLFAVATHMEQSDDALIGQAPALRAVALTTAALLDRPQALQAVLSELDHWNRHVDADDDPLLRTSTVVRHGARLLFATAGLQGGALGPHKPGISNAAGHDDKLGGRLRWRVVTAEAAAPDGSLVQVSMLYPEGPRAVAAALSSNGQLFMPLLFSMPLLLLPAALSLGWALRPWGRLSASVARRDALDLTPLPPPGPHRELQPLVAAINDWLAQLRNAREREQRFLADAAHELRTPLSAVQLSAQRLQAALGRRDEADAEAALHAVLRGSARAARLAHQLLALVRAEAEATTPTVKLDLTRWLPEVIADLAPLAQQRGVQLELALDDGADGLRLDAHPDGLQSLVVNLVDNAIRHAPPGTPVSIGLQRRGDLLRLLVQDEGPGIAEEMRASVLRRFTRGEAPRDTGSGLGLAIALSVTEVHGGQLQLLRSPGGGLCVEVELPAAEPAPA